MWPQRHKPTELSLIFGRRQAPVAGDLAMNTPSLINEDQNGRSPLIVTRRLEHVCG